MARHRSRSGTDADEFSLDGYSTPGPSSYGEQYTPPAASSKNPSKRTSRRTSTKSTKVSTAAATPKGKKDDSNALNADRLAALLQDLDVNGEGGASRASSVASTATNTSYGSYANSSYGSSGTITPMSDIGEEPANNAAAAAPAPAAPAPAPAAPAPAPAAPAPAPGRLSSYLPTPQFTMQPWGAQNQWYGAGMDMASGRGTRPRAGRKPKVSVPVVGWSVGDGRYRLNFQHMSGSQHPDDSKGRKRCSRKNKCITLLPEKMSNRGWVKTTAAGIKHKSVVSVDKLQRMVQRMVAQAGAYQLFYQDI